MTADETIDEYVKLVKSHLHDAQQELSLEHYVEVLKRVNENVELRLDVALPDSVVACESCAEYARIVVALKAEIASLNPDPHAAGFDFTAEEKEFLRKGEKIQAIHSLRRRLSVDLVTAKRLCDRGRIL